MSEPKQQFLVDAGLVWFVCRDTEASFLTGLAERQAHLQAESCCLLLLLMRCDTVLCMFKAPARFTYSHISLATTLVTSYGGANHAAAQQAQTLSTRQNICCTQPRACAHGSQQPQ